MTIFNPFRTIRLLRETLSEAEYSLARARDNNRALRVIRDALDERLQGRNLRLAQHAQAVDAFMDEREDLKAQLDQIGDAYHEVSLLLLQALGQRDAVSAEASQQASEIVEIVAWVKAAEAALADIGITVVDSVTGPAVRIGGDLERALEVAA